MAASQREQVGVEGCLARLARGMAMRIGVTVGVLAMLGLSLLCGIPTFTAITGDSTIAFLISFIGGIFITIILFVGGVVIWRSRTNSSMDEAFAQYGLTGSSYMISGRQFQGDFQGIPVQAYLQRGPILDIVMPAEFGTQAVIGTGSTIGRGINKAIDRQPLELRDPGYDNMIAFSSDPTWTDTVLHDKQVAHGVQSFMKPGFGQLRQVHFNPDELLFKIHRISFSEISSENVGQWLRIMAHVRSSAAKLPAATVIREPSNLTRTIRTGWLAKPIYLWGIVLLIVGGLVVCPALVVLLLTLGS